MQKRFRQRTFFRGDDRAGIDVVPREPAVAGFQDKLNVFGNGPYGTPPIRQDSGYVSARGSYSNDSGQIGYSRHRTSEMEIQQPPPHIRRIDGVADSPSSGENTPHKIEPSLDKTGTEKSDSPLTPTSAEILGKLAQTRKSSNGKKPEPMRQVDDMVRKYRRPQPVVAEAYRYMYNIPIKNSIC